MNSDGWVSSLETLNKPSFQEKNASTGPAIEGFSCLRQPVIKKMSVIYNFYVPTDFNSIGFCS